MNTFDLATRKPLRSRSATFSRFLHRPAVWVAATASLVAAAACGGRVHAGAGESAGSSDAGSQPLVPTDASTAFDAASPADAVAPIDVVEVPEANGPADVGAPPDACTPDPPPCGVGASGSLILPFAQYPALLTVQAAVYVHAEGYADPVCGQDGIVAFQAAPGQYRALADSSTIACCNVDLEGGELVDVCHSGAAWDLEGDAIAGPASAPLQSLGACADACAMYVAIP